MGDREASRLGKLALGLRYDAFVSPHAHVYYPEKIQLAPRVYNSGVAKNKEGDIPGSVERFKLAGELDPNFEQAHQNIAANAVSTRNFTQQHAALTLVVHRKVMPCDAHFGKGPR